MNRANPDALYELLPAIYRLRDAEKGFALQALMRVIGEQAQVVEDDIRRLYDNWFIETCQPWTVPYLGDLAGIPPHSISRPSASETEPRRRNRERLLAPRREIAHAVAHHRRKGTLSVLEDLARDVAGWPAVAVDLAQLVARFASRQERGSPSVNFRDRTALSKVGSPFDSITRFPLVRAARNAMTLTPSAVALFVFRRNVYPRTQTPARFVCHRHGDGGACVSLYTIDPLGADTRLYVHPLPKSDDEPTAPWNVPFAPPRRLLLAANRDNESGSSPSHGAISPEFYGVEKSLEVYVPGFGYGRPRDGFVPASQIVVTDLSAVRSPCSRSASKRLIRVLRDKKIAVDPICGLIAVPGSQRLVRTTHYYATALAIGGGEYRHEQLSFADSQARPHRYRSVDESRAGACKITKIGLAKLLDALEKSEATRHNEPAQGCHCTAAPSSKRLVIELCDSGIYELDSASSASDSSGQARVCTRLKAGQELVIQAAQGCRPVISLTASGARVGWHVEMQGGSVLVLDGVVFDGGPLVIDRPRDEASQYSIDQTKPRVFIHHTTLPPRRKGESRVDDQESILIRRDNCCLTIDHSIVGQIHACLPNTSDRNRQAKEFGGKRRTNPSPAEQYFAEPVLITVRDSIVDAGDASACKCDAISGADSTSLTVERSTILGHVNVEEITRADDSIFDGEVAVLRAQAGGLRFSYIPVPCDEDRSRKRFTPRQYYCQPALYKKRHEKPRAERPGQQATYDMPSCTCESSSAVAIVDEKITPPCGDSALGTQASSCQAIRPLFVSATYGEPGYCELRAECCTEIARGAEDEGEMGVFHDLYLQKRADSLRSRLDSFMPAGTRLVVIDANEHIGESHNER